MWGTQMGLHNNLKWDGGRRLLEDVQVGETLIFM